jgi:hypothetical protein
MCFTFLSIVLLVIINTIIVIVIVIVVVARVAVVCHHADAGVRLSSRLDRPRLGTFVDVSTTQRGIDTFVSTD